MDLGSSIAMAILLAVGAVVALLPEMVKAWLRFRSREVPFEKGQLWIGRDVVFEVLEVGRRACVRITTRTGCYVDVYDAEELRILIIQNKGYLRP